jgi:hypothetical protein
MGRRSSRPPRARDVGGRTSELEPFLSPEAVFSDPFDLVAHPSLTVGEKRAILARWLARICANEAALGLKWMPATSCEPVQFDEVMDALRALERDDSGPGAGRRTEAANVLAQRKPQKSVGTIH